MVLLPAQAKGGRGAGPLLHLLLLGRPLSDAWPDLVALGGWEEGRPQPSPCSCWWLELPHGPSCQTQKFSFRGQKNGQRHRADTNVIVPFWSKQSIVPR